jgi:hypothetical protein
LLKDVAGGSQKNKIDGHVLHKKQPCPPSFPFKEQKREQTGDKKAFG